MLDLPRLTADLCDQLGDRAKPLLLDWRSYGGRTEMAGLAATVQVVNNILVVRDLLAQPGRGRVLVIDNGGRDSCALIGGTLSAKAESNGWAGIVLHGRVRDTVEVAQCQIGVFALGTCPRKPGQPGDGLVDVPLQIAGVEIRPGQPIIADSDGVVVVDHA
jgi:regulator of ribonuclease activity A